MIELQTYHLIMNDGSACRNESNENAVRSVLARRRELDSSADWDALLRALSNRRRRYLLYLLAEKHRASIEELAAGVLAIEEEVLGRGAPDREPETVLVSLVHRHVPVLEDAGIVQFDDAADQVSREERFSDAIELLDGAFQQPPEREM